jgi:hypothetical protein
VKDLGFTDLKEQTSALNRVDLRSCYYLNHTSVALEFNIPAGDKRWQWLFLGRN